MRGQPITDPPDELADFVLMRGLHGMSWEDVQRLPAHVAQRFLLLLQEMGREQEAQSRKASRG
jgi:hypothetical protein